MPTFPFASAVSAILLASSATLAQPVPAVDSADLIRRADAVLVGTVVSGVDDATFDRHSITLRVDRTLKALPGLEGGRTLIIDYPHGGPPSLAGGAQGLFILRCPQGTGAPCSAANPFEPAWPTVRAVALESPSPGAEGLGAKVIRALVAVIAASDSDLAASTARGVLSPGQASQLRQQATRALSSLPRNDALEALRMVGHPSDLAERLGIVGAQVQFGDFTGLSGVAAAMLQSDPEHGEGRRYLAWGMDRIQHPPDSLVPAMSAWMTAADPVVRQMAAYTLREIGTSATVEPLLTYGIVDADMDTRYYAVSGLVAATGRGEATTREECGRAEARYLSFWQSFRRPPASAPAAP